MDQGRREHYGVFYGLQEVPRSGRPLLMVHGNCQAEALRVALDTAGVVDSVRVPPVHELVEDDLPHLHRLLGQLDVLVAQAVSDDYHGMPLGTDQVAQQLPDQGRVVRAPNYFSTALYPEQVLVRKGDPDVVDPPLVPYHDVRRIGRAAGWTGPDVVPAEAIRRGERDSLAELERREREQDSLVISDLVRGAGGEAGWTVDHPGNPVLVGLAERVLDHLGLAGDQVHDPGRVLLSSVVSPLRPEVIEALGLEAEARPGWTVDGEEVSDDEIGAAHEEFYAAHPRVVDVGVEKKAATLEALGWSP